MAAWESPGHRNKCSEKLCGSLQESRAGRTQHPLDNFVYRFLDLVRILSKQSLRGELNAKPSPVLFDDEIVQTAKAFVSICASSGFWASCSKVRQAVSSTLSAIVSIGYP